MLPGAPWRKGRIKNDCILQLPAATQLTHTMEDVPYFLSVLLWML